MTKHTKNDFKVDFFVVGAAKTGTTWLARCCEEHPEICVSDPKESYYFCHNNYYPFLPSEDYSKRPLSWYQRRYFGHCDGNMLKGDFTPLYLTYPESAHMIYTHSPDAKIIIVLRKPTDRLISLYFQFDKFYSLDSSLDKAIIKYPQLLESSKYYNQVKRYTDLFGKKNVLVLLYDDLQANPMQFLSQVFRFLGIESEFTPLTLNRRIYPRAASRNKLVPKFVQLIIRILNSNSYMIRMKHMLIFFGLDKLSWAILNLNLRAPDPIQITVKQKAWLNEFYREDIILLSLLINRDLSHWVA